MPITIFDGIVIGVVLFSAVLAMVRGFSREVLSIASWANIDFLTVTSHTSSLCSYLNINAKV